MAAKLSSPTLLLSLTIHLALQHGSASSDPPPCADLEPLCFLWSNIGECEANPTDFMRVRCALSCGLCSAADGDDADVDDEASARVVLLTHNAEELLAFDALSANDSVAQLEAGELHLILRLRSGVVLTFGDDSIGQLGQPRIARRTLLTSRATFHPSRRLANQGGVTGEI